MHCGIGAGRCGRVGMSIGVRDRLEMRYGVWYMMIRRWDMMIRGMGYDDKEMGYDDMEYVI